jgi:preprotein translocase subunit SecB
MSTEKANIQFLNTIVKESHIVFNRPGNYKIDINFIPSGIVLSSLNQFILHLKTNIRDVENGFHIEILTESTFSYPEEADIEEYKKSLFITNAPAIVFPYIRAYISSLTALSGLPVLTLPTLIMSEVGKTLSENITIQE